MPVLEAVPAELRMREYGALILRLGNILILSKAAENCTGKVIRDYNKGAFASFVIR